MHQQQFLLLHRALVPPLRLRVPPQAPSLLAEPLLSRPPLPLLWQHPLDITLVLQYLSLGHKFLIVLHHRWEASTLGLLLLINHLVREELTAALLQLLYIIVCAYVDLCLFKKKIVFLFFFSIKMLLFLQAHQHLPSVKVLPQVQYPLELQVKVSILYLLVSHIAFFFTYKHVCL